MQPILAHILRHREISQLMSKEGESPMLSGQGAEERLALDAPFLEVTVEPVPVKPLIPQHQREGVRADHLVRFFPDEMAVVLQILGQFQ